MTKKRKVTQPVSVPEKPTFEVTGITEVDPTIPESILPVVEETVPTPPDRFSSEGDEYRFELIRRTESKSEGWVRKIEGMQIFRDCLVKTSTVFYDKETGKAISCSEALALLPNVKLDQLQKGKV